MCRAEQRPLSASWHGCTLDLALLVFPSFPHCTTTCQLSFAEREATEGRGRGGAAGLTQRRSRTFTAQSVIEAQEAVAPAVGMREMGC